MGKAHSLTDGEPEQKISEFKQEFKMQMLDTARVASQSLEISMIHVDARSVDIDMYPHFEQPKLIVMRN